MGVRVPFYEYRRPDGTILEVMQKMTDPPLAEDPETGVPLQRVFHPIAVHFKGKGFYNTDYGTRNRQRETAAAAEKSSSSEKSSSESSSSDKSSSSSSSDKSSSSESAASSSSESKSEKATAKPKKDAKPLAAKGS